MKVVVSLQISILTQQGPDLPAGQIQAEGPGVIEVVFKQASRIGVALYGGHGRHWQNCSGAGFRNVFLVLLQEALTVGGETHGGLAWER